MDSIFRSQSKVVPVFCKYDCLLGSHVEMIVTSPSYGEYLLVFMKWFHVVHGYNILEDVLHVMVEMLLA